MCMWRERGVKTVNKSEPSHSCGKEGAWVDGRGG